MNKNEIWKEVEREMKADRKQYPSLHDHIVSRSAIVSSAAADLQKTCISVKYSRDNEMMKDIEKERVRQHAIKTIVKSIRFLESIK